MFLFLDSLSSFKLFISLVYPTFNSIKSVVQDQDDFDISKDWLKYWSIFGIFTVVEILTDPFLLNNLPSADFTALTIFKILFIVWCMVPIKNNGSLVIYDKVNVKNYWNYMICSQQNNNSNDNFLDHLSPCGSNKSKAWTRKPAS